MSNSSRHFLCRFNDLADPGSTARSLTFEFDARDILLVRSKQRVYGYLNSCPHTGGPLDWTPGHFLSVDKRHIQCATHAALFRIDDGICVAGPCTGDRLSAVTLEVDDGNVYLLSDADTCGARGD